MVMFNFNEENFRRNLDNLDCNHILGTVKNDDGSLQLLREEGAGILPFVPNLDNVMMFKYCPLCGSQIFIDESKLVYYE